MSDDDYYFFPPEDIWQEQPDGSRVLAAAKGVPIIRTNARDWGLEPDERDRAAAEDALLDKLARRIEQRNQQPEPNRQERKALYDRVIEKYNRAHGQNRKISLEQVCIQMGVSYEAVRKHRQRKSKPKSPK